MKATKPKVTDVERQIVDQVLAHGADRDVGHGCALKNQRRDEGRGQWHSLLCPLFCCVVCIFFSIAVSGESFASEGRKTSRILGEERVLPPVECEISSDHGPGEIAWSPDGQRLADLDCGLVLWGVDTWTIIKHAVTTPSSWPLAFVDGGDRIITAWVGYRALPVDHSSDTSGLIIDTGGDFLFDIPEFPPKDIPYAMTLFDGRRGDILRDIPGPQFNGFGTILHLTAVSRAGNAALLFNTRTGQALSLYSGSGKSTVLFGPQDAPYHDFVHDIALSPDGRTLALLKMIYRPSQAGLAYDTRKLGIVLWDVVENHAIKTIDLPITRITASYSRVRWSPDGHDLAVGFSVHEIHAQIWRIDAKTGKTVQTHNFRSARNKGPSGEVWAMDWSGDGRLIAACILDYSSLQILDAPSMTLLEEIPLPAPCTSVAFSPDSSMLAYVKASQVKASRSPRLVVRKILSRILH